MDKPANSYAIINGHSKISYPSAKGLSCPSFKNIWFKSGDDFNYAFAMNQDVVGGIGDERRSPPLPNWGVYGISVSPNGHSYRFSADDPTFYKYQYYSLGPKLTNFRPNQFLIIETEYSPLVDDPFCGFANSGLGYTNGAGKVKLGSTPNYPKYSGGAADNGMYLGKGSASFRHPYSKRGNFLLINGTVESLTPDDEILTPRRFGMGLN